MARSNPILVAAGRAQAALDKRLQQVESTGVGGAVAGALSGTLPNVDIAAGYIRASHIASDAAIPEAALALASDAPPTTPSRRSSALRCPVTWYKGDCFGGLGATADALSQGNTFFTFIWVTQIETWDQVSLDCVTTAGSTGAVVRAGIYADDGSGRPEGALLADCGTAAFTTLGAKTWSTSLQVTPGMYHLAFKLEGAPTTPPKIRTIQGVYPNAPANATGVTSSGYYVLGAAGAFPSPGAGSTPGSGFRPMGRVRVASRP